MRGRSGNRHVRAEMELRPQEDDPQEQGHKTYTLSAARHVFIKTKLKTDWLQGQVGHPGEVLISTRRAQPALPRLKKTVEQVREEFLTGIPSDDLNRLGSVLSALYENAGRLYQRRVLSRLPRDTKGE